MVSPITERIDNNGDYQCKVLNFVLRNKTWSPLNILVQGHLLLKDNNY